MHPNGLGFAICIVIIFSICSCKKSGQGNPVTNPNAVPDSINLYDGAIPNSISTVNNEYYTVDEDNNKYYYNVSRPKLYAYIPQKELPSGTSVIICPGGAYAYESFTTEGSAVAKQFAANGITAFVLKYRIPNSLTMINKTIGPLQDAQRAIQIIRQNAVKWGLSADNVGIMGFSAGGHLASTAATHFDTAYISNTTGTSLKPAFQCLIYPVISMTDSLYHQQSRDQLLGTNPSQSLIYQFSNEFQVTATTPPGFLVHCMDDPIVDVKNSIYYDAALKKNNITEQLYLYPTGGHGFGLNNPSSPVKWFDIMMPWLQTQGFVVK